MPSRLHGTELSAEEWRDNARLRYNLNPLSMPSACDGCGAKMTVEHALSCKVGGLVHIRHDDVADEFGHLCELAFSKGRVTHEPLINACETRLERKARELGEVKAPTMGGIADAASKLMTLRMFLQLRMRGLMRCHSLPIQGEQREPRGQECSRLLETW